MKISAAIFDLDGTVIQSEEEWSDAFKKVLREVGVDVSKGYAQVVGIGVKANWAIFQKKYKLGEDYNLDELSNKTYQEFVKLIPRVNLTEGFLELVDRLKESGIKIALATSTEWWIAEKIFDSLPIGDVFDSITTGDEVVNKKPSPDLFLAASDKLDVLPEECIVVEDASSGIEAAHAAGMKAIGLARDAAHTKTLKEADLVVSSFDEVTPEVLAETF